MAEPILELKSGSAPKTLGSGARSTRLREFQAQLVERMQAANSTAVAHSRRLGVLIGQSYWLLSLQDAGEIGPVGTIAKVPLTQDWFLGLTNIRGNLISVVDFGRFCGMPVTPIDKECRVIVFAPALGFNSGVLVSRVMGLRNVSEMEPQSDESANMPWAVQRYVDRDSQVWTEINLSLIVQDPRFLHIGS